MIGQIINYRYEVLEKIGEGDIFTVYKSRDKVLNRLVALKFLNKECAGHRDFAKAVRVGYQGAAPLDHPYIARVLDADPTSDECFVACEYVRGLNVKDRINRAGAIQVPVALDIIVPVLEALEYAHANRMPHGDLRPQDIVVSSDGEVKVTDFGLSSALMACPEVEDRFSMRSVRYQAPEIAEGAAPSVSADLYSVGVILYEMLTGVLPYDGPTAIAVALKKTKDTPTAPRSINTGVPKSLSDLIMRAIDNNPEERFQSASSMLSDLRSIRDALKIGRPVSLPQPSVSRQIGREEREESDEPEGLLTKASYLWLMLGFVLVMLIVGGITFHLSTRDSKIEVPYILGMTVDEAREAARQAGMTLEPDEPGETYSNDYDEGKIAFQTPAGHAKVPKDKKIVKYRVSKGPSAKRVPDLTGLPEAEAYQAAQDAGFSVGKVTTEYSDTVPVNAVIKQDPSKGALATPDSPISMVLSLGVKPEAAPDYTSSDDSAPPPDSQERSFQVGVTVPSDANGQQEVRIVVDDDRGESTAVQEFHDPGDRFTQSVTAYGKKIRIKVYVGGHLVNDQKY